MAEYFKTNVENWASSLSNLWYDEPRPIFNNDTGVDFGQN